MDLSVIIVNYRGWDHLSACLDSLRDLNIRISSEVIIVDNNSSDGKLNEFKSGYPGFIFISNDVNGGFANGCNLGSRYANGDFLLFLNPDTVAETGEIEKLFHRAKDHPENYISSCRQIDKRGRESKAYGLFQGFGTITGTGRSLYRLLFKNQINEKPEEGNYFFRPDWVSGSVILISKEIFNSIGRFDEDYWMYFEDMDLCRRARDRGGNIIYFTDISIQHNHGGSSRVNLKTTSLTKTEVLISNHQYLFKHNKGVKKFLLMSWLIIVNLISGFFSALAGIILFFKPKMLSRACIFLRLISYYSGVIKRGNWVSPRSVNFH
jgi:GT2 family glycosyltransferase